MGVITAWPSGSSAVTPAQAWTVPVALPTVLGAPAPLDPDTNIDCGCEPWDLVVLRIPSEFSSRPYKVTRLTYYQLRGYFKTLFQNASVGGGTKFSCGAWPSTMRWCITSMMIVWIVWLVFVVFVFLLFKIEGGGGSGTPSVIDWKRGEGRERIGVVHFLF